MSLEWSQSRNINRIVNLLYALVNRKEIVVKKAVLIYQMAIKSMFAKDGEIGNIVTQYMKVIYINSAVVNAVLRMLRMPVSMMPA